MYFILRTIDSFLNVTIPIPPLTHDLRDHAGPHPGPPAPGRGYQDLYQGEGLGPQQLAQRLLVQGQGGHLHHRPQLGVSGPECPGMGVTIRRVTGLGVEYAHASKCSDIVL